MSQPTSVAGDAERVHNGCALAGMDHSDTCAWHTEVSFCAAAAPMDMEDPGALGKLLPFVGVKLAPDALSLADA